MSEQLEYLELFSNIGQVKVQVKFQDFNGSVTNLAMEPHELSKIISEQSGQFIKFMSFDDWPFTVYKYEIDPINNILTIRARRNNIIENNLKSN